MVSEFWSLKHRFRIVGLLTALFALFVSSSASYADEKEEEEEPAKAWADMTVEEKLDTIQASSLELNEDGTVKGANESALTTLRTESNWLWTCIAAFLVFFMQAGFSLVEAGFTRAKNCINIIMKNVMDLSIGTLSFWAIGFGLMFGLGTGFCGTSDFLVSGIGKDGKLDHNTFTFWMFQVVFAATAATIVSGAVAERTKFVGYICYTIGITAIIYPIFGSWAWGGLFHGDDGKRWLENLGFMDFAGSTVVHSVGGWAALAGAIVLGPRKGKYSSDGRVNVIPGHSIPLAALGVFILWLGWFGFNAGSTTSVGGGEFARVAVTTTLAASAGALSAMIMSWIKFKKPDVTFTLNGALAGLVGITAPCYNVGTISAVIIGLVAGLIVVFSVLFFDKIKIDDPVGAISVHGVCGVWGTLACGLFAQDIYGGGGNGLFFGGGLKQLGIQLVGVGVCFAWTFATSMVLFMAIKATVGIRVSEEEEAKGLDITEHGMVAYPGFQSIES